MASEISVGSRHAVEGNGHVSAHAMGKKPAKEEVLLEVSAQAPSPSRNFYQVLVTPSLVTLRWWPISFHLGAQAKPGEKKVPLEDYRYDSRTRDDIKYNMGTEVEKQVFRVAGGMNDALSLLPRKILDEILQMLDLQSLHQLGCCNSYLHEISSSNNLWKKIYLSHHGWASDELRQLAEELSWKKIFFMNKLQLQVILSRRRRQSSAGAERSQPKSTTFITSS